jgi:prophage regulatory protein
MRRDAMSKETTDTGTAPQRIYRMNDLEPVTGYGREGIKRLLRHGLFPRPIPLGGGRAIGWLESDIVRWQQERIAARDGT